MKRFVVLMMLFILLPTAFAGENPDRKILFHFEDGSVVGWVSNTYAGTPERTVLKCESCKRTKFGDLKYENFGNRIIM